MTTTADLLTNALMEMGAYAQSEVPNIGDTNFALSKLNRMLDAWNASKLFIYAVNFQQYTMIANKNPQTIGQAFSVSSVQIASNIATVIGVPFRPFFGQGSRVTLLNIGNDGGIFNVSQQILSSVSTDGTTLTFPLTGSNYGPEPATGVVIPADQPANTAPDFPIPSTRPVKIVNANILLNYGTGSGLVRVPMRIVDADWWANQRVPQIETTLPTHLYYQPSFPNGQLYFWPVPQIAYPAELETWTNLAGLALTDTFVMPPGYEDAVTYSLAESMCPAFGRPIDATLANLAMKARALIQGLNSDAPLITTADFGIPGPSSDQRGRADFNWKTGNLAG
jgi:hypothetical protein